MLWSKSQGLTERYPLLSHQLDAAASALALWDRWLRPGLQELIEESLGDNARTWLAYAAGQHDTGKANPVFQAQLCSQRPEPWHKEVQAELMHQGFNCEVGLTSEQHLRRHEKVSAMELAVRKLDTNIGVNDEWIALSALGHHGCFELPNGKASRKAFGRYAGGKWSEVREANTRALREVFGLTEADSPPSASAVVATLISGLIILADRTASDIEAVKDAQARLRGGVLELMDPKGWVDQQYQYFSERLKMTLGIYKDFGSVDDARTSIMQGGRALRPLQEASFTVGDGLWFAMAPTGNGKTEAALLRHVQRAERLIFALPTQATTNAMMTRVQQAFKGTGNVAEIAHGMASIEDFYSTRDEFSASTDDQGLHPSEFLRNGTARLLAPVSVCTIDQVLIGSLRTKWEHLRLLTLANAHLVLDEAHLMDYYQTRLAEQLMQWWGVTHTRVTVLTATLPQWQRDAFSRAYSIGAIPGFDRSPEGIPMQDLEFPSHEEVPGKATRLESSEYKIDITLTSSMNLPIAHEDMNAAMVQAHANWVRAQRRAFPHARLGVVANTVKRVQDIARELDSDGISIVVLHSRMTAGHRRDVANQLLRDLGPQSSLQPPKMRKGLVLVGSQAIEASLDIDLDALSTDIAPAPSLIQRAGRVWRHNSDDDEKRRSQRIPGIPHLPLHVVYGVGVGAALPYFDTELTRVRAYLTQHDQLAMPSCSQEFVEKAALKIDSITDEELRELADISMKVIKAGGVKISVDELMFGETEFSTFGRLTGEDVKEELATRLIKQPSITAIVIGEGGQHGIPGVWTGSIRDIERINPSDREQIRTLMEATVPLNGKIAQTVMDARSGKQWETEPQSKMVAAMWPVRLGSGPINYDPLLGMTMEKTS